MMISCIKDSNLAPAKIKLLESAVGKEKVTQLQLIKTHVTTQKEVHIKAKKGYGKV